MTLTKNMSSELRWFARVLIGICHDFIWGFLEFSGFSRAWVWTNKGFRTRISLGKGGPWEIKTRTEHYGKQTYEMYWHVINHSYLHGLYMVYTTHLNHLNIIYGQVGHEITTALLSHCSHSSNQGPDTGHPPLARGGLLPGAVWSEKNGVLHLIQSVRTPLLLGGFNPSEKY